MSYVSQLTTAPRFSKSYSSEKLLTGKWRHWQMQIPCNANHSAKPITQQAFACELPITQQCQFLSFIKTFADTSQDAGAERV